MASIGAGDMSTFRARADDDMRSRVLSVLVPALGIACTGACAGTRTLSDPTIEIRSPGGSELGVSTNYGILFLGHTAQGGRIEVTAWFGDGPDIESAVIEPIGGALYTADTEIRLPPIPIEFHDPAPGSSVLVIGRRGEELWQRTFTVASDPRVEGLLLDGDGSGIGIDQVGAGVFVLPNEDEDAKRLVGLVSGQLTLSGADGERRYLTVVGPRDLWRLVAHRRDLTQRKRWVYRRDIM